MKISGATIPGAGAAGGLGFGLMAFAGAQTRAGFEVFAEAVNLEELIGKVDLVITGEGAVDRQSFMGKGVGQIALLCKKLKVPCVAIAGMVNVPARSLRLFSSTVALAEMTTIKEAKARTAFYLEKAAAMAGSAPW